VPLTKPRRSSSVVGPPSCSCQPRLARHPCRVRFAVAWLGASPTGCTVRRGSFLPCSSVTRALSKSLRICADREDVDPSAPPNTPCTRPPCCCDFSRQPVPTAHSVYRVALVGRRVMFTVGLAAFSVCCSSPSAQLASINNAGELPCRAHTRVHHLLSSKRRGTPASHRLPLTRAAHASPLFHIALRLWLHGSARLILSVRVRV
jgi:hypothetical protein